MIGAIYCLVGALLAYNQGRKSAGRGLVVVLLWGYAYGYVRARFFDGLTHFGFDAALIAFYVSQFTKPVTLEMEQRQKEVLPWVAILCAWPFVCMAYSPIFEESQPFVVQLVGLRATVLCVPILLVAARMNRADLDHIAPWVAVLNCGALAVALIEYAFGVDAVMPRNAATELMYMSHDVMASGQSYFRIPSTFPQSHVYGLTMNMSLPFVAQGFESGKRVRLLCIAGLAAAVLGVFLSGARTPVVFLGLTVVYVLTTLRVKGSTWAVFLLVCAAIGYVVLNNTRLQRFETLTDTEYVEGRLESSVNEGFVDALIAHPLGAGLASAFGTSIPHFLQAEARPQIGLENEYARIVIETGIPGLGMWCFFFLNTLRRRDLSEATPGAKAFAAPLILLTILGGALGAGMFTAVPGSCMFLFLVGLRSSNPLVLRPALGLRAARRSPDGAPAPPRFGPSGAVVRARSSLQSGGSSAT